MLYTYGDIVKKKFAKFVEHFIIVDMVDFSKSEDGSDVVYEVMRIYPVAKTSKIANFEEKELELIARGNSKDGRIALEWVMTQRIHRGWLEEADFIAVMNHNMKTAKLKKVLPPQLDVIHYDKLQTVDDCLDALNDLKRLHNMFGDESFLQLREVVLKRLEYFVD